jgi:acyl dehydratase
VSPRRRFEDVAIGEELPALRRRVERGIVARYAEVSGDQNPLHHDDQVAQAAGFSGIVAHGMLTMGHVASCLTAWAGDARSLRRMRVAFRSAVSMGDEIEAGGRVKALDPATRRVTLDVWVRVVREGAEEFPIRRSEAEVELA